MGNGVCAVIVTYNRQRTLVKCLEHVRNLTEQPQKVLVVDNASTDGTPELVRTRFPEFEVLALQTNAGGAGGFDAGMRHAYASGYDYVWLFDDDAYVDPDCLGRLLRHTDQADVLLPLQVDQTGRSYGVHRWVDNQLKQLQPGDGEGFEVDTFTFVGPLIKRSVIEKIGWPRVDFFICADDTEYSLRIMSAGLRAIYVPEAIFHHDYGGKTVAVRRLGRQSFRSSEPPWKRYYAVRNDILILKELGGSREYRSKYLAYTVYKLLRMAAGEAFYERDFPARLRYSLLGTLDGLLGRTGKRVQPVVKG